MMYIYICQTLDWECTYCIYTHTYMYMYIYTCICLDVGKAPDQAVRKKWNRS